MNCAESMNYMEQIANMLGVELGEHFDITNNKGKIVAKDLWLTESGLKQKGMEDSRVLPHILNSLLVGDRVISKRLWKPELGEFYCYINNSDGEIRYRSWADSIVDFLLYKFGKVYQTIGEAEMHKEKDIAFLENVWRKLEE